ncbi:DUF5366 family protein [Peribacillus frigoritolerans]|uniref:DUF5366 family protein n=1 Tax=Peribacillus frigoritolerans TaxID=450367 RepID=UPI00381DBCFC
MLKLFGNSGIYQGMLEFFSEAGIKLALLIVLLLLFFMVFAALKLISDTILELSLLFFSKDSEGKALNSVREGSVIYVIGGACSLFSVQFIFGIGSIFIATNVVASGIGLLSDLRLDGIDFNSRLCGIEQRHCKSSHIAKKKVPLRHLLFSLGSLADIFPNQ